MMESRMFKAACSGDVKMLNQLLQENPFILSEYALINFLETALITSVKANQSIFAREILKLKPELATELNQDGVRPLDIASANGNIEIVRDILSAKPETCRLAGREGRTAIHYAAINGRVEVIDQLVSACSDCIRDVTSYGETVLHLAVKFFKFEVLKRALWWTEELGAMEIVNRGDVQGNTVLHCAVSRKQLESVDALLEWNIKTGNRVFQLNAVNRKCLTPLDISDMFIESTNDVHLRERLRLSGCCPASEHYVTKYNHEPEPDEEQPANNDVTSKEMPKNWPEMSNLFKFKWQKNTPGEARETLLLVAVLIATVTFEAGINPPSYLFEHSNGANVEVTRQYSNGTVLNETQWNNSTDFSSMASITVFLVANSIALSTSTSIIDYLTSGLPFQREIRVSLFGMLFAYGWSLASTKPTGRVKNILLICAVCMPLFLRWLPYWVTKIRKVAHLRRRK